MKLTHLVLGLSVIASSTFLFAESETFSIKRAMNKDDSVKMLNILKNAGMESSPDDSSVMTTKAAKIMCNHSAICKLMGKTDATLSVEDSEFVNKVFRNAMDQSRPHKEETSAHNMVCKEDATRTTCTFDVMHSGISKPLSDEEAETASKLFKYLDVHPSYRTVYGSSKSATIRIYFIGRAQRIEAILDGKHVIVPNELEYSVYSTVMQENMVTVRIDHLRSYVEASLTHQTVMCQPPKWTIAYKHLDF